MEGFTVALALVDAIPVLFFGASMILIASKLHSPLFVIGAILSTLAGCCKVAWKLILGTSKKDVKWLNKCFLPLMGAGWLLILISLIFIRNGAANTDWFKGLLAMPSVLFLVLWVIMMVGMGWYKKTRFENTDAKKNWTVQIINIIGQAALFFAILFAK